MQNYLDLLKDIMDNGIELPDRTGVGRRKVFGRMLRFDLSSGDFPLVTTRQIDPTPIVEELFWFRDGKTNVKDLHGVKIWNKWAVRPEHVEAFVKKYGGGDVETEIMLREGLTHNTLGEIGPLYGEAWRNAPLSFYNHFSPRVTEADIAPDKLAEYKEAYEDRAATMGGAFVDNEGNPVSFDDFLQVVHYQQVDQLQELLINLKKRPFSSRHVISCWIPEYLAFEELSPQENVMMGRGALAPCHVLQQYLVFPPKEAGGKNRLSLMMTQRSADFPVGSVYNIAQYALLLAMVAQVSDMEPFEFIYTLGDTHVYLDQKALVEDQLSRTPYPAPKLWLNPEIKNLFDFKKEDVKIIGYQAHPPIKYPVAI